MESVLASGSSCLWFWSVEGGLRLFYQRRGDADVFRQLVFIVAEVMRAPSYEAVVVVEILINFQSKVGRARLYSRKFQVPRRLFLSHSGQHERSKQDC